MVENYIIEFGCGLGIAGIACLKMGATHVILTDIEQVILDVAADNVRLNDISLFKVQFMIFDALSFDPTTEKSPSPYPQILIASDVLFTRRHSEGFAVLISKWLKSYINAQMAIISHEHRQAISLSTDGHIHTETSDDCFDLFIHMCIGEGINVEVCKSDCPNIQHHVSIIKLTYQRG